ncbi:hypothetical protein FOTG_01929 [Fusarium oxysporum f. sp. vasinfectum 25433]|uniref:Uncharacterized protein n=1 Tax=Fusarium oxysporum f. sp. vasinfectum 25433 TaxID=1089449 RepID=X0NSI4_FUSOX|nr:hypothetical protein FOTG_01929 [Fusarium oxysporum f. sp. vasinfectum 25433]
MARPDCQNQYGGPADLAVASCFSSERAKMIALKRAGEDEMAAPCNNVFYRWFNSPQNGYTIEAKRTVVDRYNCDAKRLCDIPNRVSTGARGREP